MPSASRQYDSPAGGRRLEPLAIVYGRTAESGVCLSDSSVLAGPGQEVHGVRVNRLVKSPPLLRLAMRWRCSSARLVA